MLQLTHTAYCFAGVTGTSEAPKVFNISESFRKKEKSKWQQHTNQDRGETDYWQICQKSLGIVPFFPKCLFGQTSSTAPADLAGQEKNSRTWLGITRSCLVPTSDKLDLLEDKSQNSTQDHGVEACPLSHRTSTDSIGPPMKNNLQKTPH